MSGSITHQVNPAELRLASTSGPTPALGEYAEDVLSHSVARIAALTRDATPRAGAHLVVLQSWSWSAVPDGAGVRPCMAYASVDTPRIVRTVDVPAIDPAGMLAEAPELGAGITRWLALANRAGARAWARPGAAGTSLEIALTDGGQEPAVRVMCRPGPDLGGDEMTFDDLWRPLAEAADQAYNRAWLAAWHEIAGDFTEARAKQLRTLVTHGPHWDWTPTGGWSVVDAGPRRTMLVTWRREGGDYARWMPIAEAQAEIFAAANPEATAIDMCLHAPLRGRWL